MISINYKIIARTIGIQLIIVAILMLAPVSLLLFDTEVETTPFLLSFAITSAVGLLLFLQKPTNTNVQKREGYLIVALGWTLMCAFGALPYFVSDSASAIQAIFESTSGFTTTGASIFNDIEGLDNGILLWRSLTQWIGGMGIIVFTIAIFPMLGIGGVELFVAESPGPTAEKMHPRIKEVAKRLWFIYVGLTTILAAILYFTQQMNGFDSINHAMTTISTGGFSTKNASIAFFESPMIEYILTVFMLVAGVNFTIIYFGIKGKWRHVWRSEEFRYYLFLTFIVVAFITLVLYAQGNNDIEESFRYSAFSVISSITTTGFVSVNYIVLAPQFALFFFLLLFTGGSAGSTSGGIKMIRHLVFLKNAKLEFQRILHPNAYIRLKIDGAIVPSKTLLHILVFLFIYLSIFMVGTIIMSFLLVDDSTPMLTAAGAVATSLGNVGPGIGSLGPVDNFNPLTPSAHILLSILMVIGRLELFTILIIFTPKFWKPN